MMTDIHCFHCRDNLCNLTERVECFASKFSDLYINHIDQTVMSKASIVRMVVQDWYENRCERLVWDIIYIFANTPGKWWRGWLDLLTDAYIRYVMRDSGLQKRAAGHKIDDCYLNSCRQANTPINTPHSLLQVTPDPTSSIHSLFFPYKQGRIK